MAPPSAFHGPNRGATSEERAFQIDVYGVTPFIQRRMLDRRLVKDPGRVDEDVQPSMGLYTIGDD